jgi:hypothetical protein
MPRKKVLITVTTYPLPSRSYDELVCTAGVLEDGSWIRIYPMPLSFLNSLKVNGKISKTTKYTWVELDLNKRTDDFRPESHSPADYEFKDMQIYETLGPEKFWEKRKLFCLKNVYTDLAKLIEDSKAPKNTSLATFKPKEILDFVIEETDREWKDTWKAQFQQSQINFEKVDEVIQKEPPRKIPFEFSYKFIDENGKQSKLMIEDWEIGQLYWNCLKDTGDERKACEKVKQRYLEQFKNKHDIYLFLGTTKTHHMKRSRNPFVIIGVFYPMKNLDTQISLW